MRRGWELAIRMYWFFVPAGLRRRCLFAKSCSHHVLEAALSNGSKGAWSALFERMKQCRSGSFLYRNPLDHRWQMRLPDGTIIDEPAINPNIIPTVVSQRTAHELDSNP